MAYTRQYPNSITPNGSTTRSCLENDDKELKRVLGLISDVGGLMLSGTKRQCVLYGSTDSSGNPNFLTASGLNVSIDGSSKPVILSFANGFSATSGTLDTLDAITSAVSSAWTIPANSTYYLFIEKDMSTGLLSYGRTANEDTYSKSAPSSPVLDQCYFNTNEMKMYHYNGSAWEQKWRIFVAKAVSTDSTVTLTQYPMESKAFIRDNLESKNINAETLNNTEVSSLSPHTLKRSTAYVVGDVAYSSNLPSWARLECVTAGTTAAVEPTWPTTAGRYITDGYVKWVVDDIRDGGLVGRVVGDIVLRAGYVKANGATVNRADYPRLYNFATTYSQFYDDGTREFTGTVKSGSKSITDISASDIAKLSALNLPITISDTDIKITAISTTSVTIDTATTADISAGNISYGNITNFPGLFGTGNGSTTMVLPNWIGRMAQMSSGVSGQAISAGLPNITGKFQDKGFDSLYTFSPGALYNGGDILGSRGSHGTSGDYLHSLAIDASRSSAIYGASTTVQPAAINLIPQIKY